MVRPVSIVPFTSAIPPGVPGTTRRSRASLRLPAALEHMRRAGYPYDPGTDTGGWAANIRHYTITRARTSTPRRSPAGPREDRAPSRAPRGELAGVAGAAEPEKAAAMTRGLEHRLPRPSDFFDPSTRRRPSRRALANVAFYRNPRLDDLLARPATSSTPGAQALYREANPIVCDEAPWAFTFYFTRSSCGSPTSTASASPGVGRTRRTAASVAPAAWTALAERPRERAGEATR